MLKGAGTIMGGQAQAGALKSEAKQYEIGASNIRGMGQREAVEERRQADIQQSRALALAAASGGGASDPTVMDIMARLAGEGEYRALSKMYSAETEAQGYDNAAKVRKFEAKNTRTAALIGGAGSILGAAAKQFGAGKAG